MKSLKQKMKPYTILTLVLISFMGLSSCTSDNEEILIEVNSTALSDQEKADLLFILEEEKMARDVYTFLYEKWQIPIFYNISGSESAHMSAVANVLQYYDIAYEIKPYGEYNNDIIQGLYDDLVASGSQSELDAYIVGATIEDVDIFDLEESMAKTDNNYIEDVFESLQCGSRNHLREFVKNIELANGTYSPQFISETEYQSIIKNTNESCN